MGLIKVLLVRLLGGLGVLAFFVTGVVLFRSWGGEPHTDTFSLKRDTKETYVHCGFYKAKINPRHWETWEDKNRDGVFQPQRGERFDDFNKNGVFDGLYLSNHHKGTCLRENREDWYMTCWVVSYKRGSLCIINYDGGPMAYRLSERIREKLRRHFGIDYVLLVPNNDRFYPDLIGDKGIYHFSGINREYYHLFESACARCVDRALLNRKKYSLYYQGEKDAQGYLFRNSKQQNEALVLFSNYTKINGLVEIPREMIKRFARENNIKFTLIMNNACINKTGVIAPVHDLWALAEFQPVSAGDDLFFKRRTVRVPLLSCYEYVNVFFNKTRHRMENPCNYLMDVSLLGFYHHNLIFTGLWDQKILPDLLKNSLKNGKKIVSLEGVNEGIVVSAKEERILMNDIAKLKDDLEMSEIMKKIKEEENNEFD